MLSCPAYGVTELRNVEGISGQLHGRPVDFFILAHRNFDFHKVVVDAAWLLEVPLSLLVTAGGSWSTCCQECRDLR